MNNPGVNMPALAALDADELRVMITSVNKLTNQMAVLTDYFERAGSRLHQQHTEDLDKAVERILHEGYGPEEAGGAAPTGLDSCNGHTHANADFPQGTYHYHVTVNTGRLGPLAVDLVAMAAQRHWARPA